MIVGNRQEMTQRNKGKTGNLLWYDTYNKISNILEDSIIDVVVATLH